MALKRSELLFFPGHRLPVLGIHLAYESVVVAVIFPEEESGGCTARALAPFTQAVHGGGRSVLFSKLWKSKGHFPDGLRISLKQILRNFGNLYDILRTEYNIQPWPSNYHDCYSRPLVCWAEV